MQSLTRSKTMYVREHWLEIRVEWFLEKKRALGRLCQIVLELINVPIFESRKEMLYPSTLLYSVQYMTGSFSSSWSLALLVLRTLLYNILLQFSLWWKRQYVHMELYMKFYSFFVPNLNSANFHYATKSCFYEQFWRAAND